MTGLSQPVQMEFIGDNDFFVLEKPTGQVKRVKDGVATVVLDLTVNSNSERGLLGIALDKYFKFNGSVYLYWSETTQPADNAAGDAVPLRGNRLDRFHWDGTALVYEKTLHRSARAAGRRRRTARTRRCRVFRGNHNGGVVRVGPKDGKIYLQVGDTGRRGQLQNLVDGPFVFPPHVTATIGDDQFGGPDPDANHLTGVILRLNPDGTAPRDNPFYRLGAERGGSVGASLKKVYAYGLRNGFGMAFDPFSGDLWEQENGDDSFSEINRTEPGFNSGWVQVMGPLVARRAVQGDRDDARPRSRRIPPRRPATTASSRPAGTRSTSPTRRARRTTACSSSRARSSAIRRWRGSTRSPRAASTSSPARSSARTTRASCSSARARGSLRGGNLFRLPIANNRKKVDPDDRRLKDSVADNVAKYEITESESLLFGENFGVTPDLKESPDGSLYVVSSTQGRCTRSAQVGRVARGRGVRLRPRVGFWG